MGSMNNNLTTAAPAAGRAIDSTRFAAVAAILFGMFLVYGAGFAQPDLLHNVAHDSRHSMAFPCH